MFKSNRFLAIIILFLLVVVIGSCGGGKGGGGTEIQESKESNSDGGESEVTSGDVNSTEDYYGTIILPSGSSLQLEDLEVSSIASKQAVNIQGNFQKPQFLGNQQLLFVYDQGGNIILMGYFFPEDVSVPDSLRNSVVSQDGITINAESTAFALCLNNPILSGLDVGQLTEVASIVIELPEFISFVSEIESLLVNDPSNIFDITAHPEIFMKANQITGQALSSWGQSSSATLASISNASSAAVIIDNKAAYIVDDYYDQSTGSQRHAFANDVFVSYVGEFSPTVGISPFPPILIDRDRALKLNWCSKFPFLCWERSKKYTPFDVDSGDYTVTIWRGFSSDIWLASDGSMYYSKCLTDGFSDAPCLASQLAFLDIVSPVLGLAGIKVTGVQIVNGLDNFVDLDVESLWQVYEVIKDISVPSIIDGLSILTNVIKKNSTVLASILKNSEIEFNGNSTYLFTDTDERQLAKYIERQSGVVNDLLNAASSIKTVTEAAAILIPMTIDFHSSPEKVTYYLHDGKLVESLPSPVTSVVIISPPDLSQETLSVGTKIQFGVSGWRADNSTVDLTDQVQWGVVGGIGTIAPNGSFTATSIGTGQVTALYNELYAKSDQFSIVSSASPSLIKLAVEGPSAVSSGQTAQYAALGIYDNGSIVGLTDEVSWSVQGSIGSVSPTGLFNASQDGTGSIEASYSGIVGTSTPITVSIAGESPLPPTNLSGVAVSPTQVNLTWNQSTGATSYIVYRNGVRIGTTTPTSYSDGGLLPSTTYTYTVMAFGSNGASPQSYTFNVTTPATTAAAQSDLVIQNLSVSPTSSLAESSVTVSFTIYNQGSGTANANTTNIRLNTSSGNVTTSDPLLASFSIPSIAAGSTYNVSRTVTISSGSSAGLHYVWAILDVNSTANQSNETNDRGYTTFTVTTASATLTVSSVSPSTIMQGSSYQNVTIYGSNFTSSSWYEYSVSDGSSWALATSAPTVNSSTSMTIGVNNTIVQTVYFRVCASNGSNDCSGSVAITVEAAVSVPAIPSGTSPGTTFSPGPTTSSTTVTLSWSSVNGATEYGLGVRDISTGSLVVNTSLSGTSYSQL